MKKIYLLIALLCTFALNGFSQLLTEDFSYTAGQAITANGWTAHSGSGTNAIAVTSPGLTYTGHPGSGVGNAVTMTTSGEDDNRGFTAVTTGSTYLSFLVNISAAQTTGDYFIGLFQTTTIFPLRIYVKATTGGYFFGVSKGSGAITYETTVRTFGTTYFVVSNYTLNTGTATDDVVNFWVNPALGGTEPAADLTANAGSDGASVAAVYLRQGSATAASTQQVDAILVGTTWASVTPSGSAATPALSATALTAFGNVCLNTASTANSFTITGTNLTTADVVVGALAGYTYSTTVGGTYAATLNITPTAGAVSQQVFVKLTPTAVQSYNGNIPVSGGGVSTAINVAATGAGINTTATVTAGAATGITATGATIPGTIPTTGCSTVTAYGAEYSTTTGFTNGTGTQVPSTNLAANAFTAVIASGLTGGTTYYYHTFATNGGGAVYSAEQSFTTTGAPLLTATVLTAFGNVCLNTASTANSFTITGSNLTTANVVVGALAGYTYSTTVGGTYAATLNITPTAGAVSQQVFVKLTPTAVQSYNGNIPVSGGGVSTAINVAATGAGINTTATVTAGAATGISATGATIPGTIPTTGCSTVTAYGAEYSTTTGFANGSGTQIPSTNLSGTAFTAVIASGLTASTTYYYHTFATNGGGTVYSAEQSFTTVAAATATLSATALTAFGNVCLNTASTANSFTITGSNLTTANVVVGALAGYTYSTTVGGTYAATLNITPTAGAVSQQVFVKLTPTAVQSYNGNIGISGGGATAINVAATGAGINTTATVTAGAATGITATGATIPGTIPTTGCSTVTAYGAEYSTTTGFTNGTGTQVPSTNLAANAFTAVIASGLTGGTTYYYHTFATNGGGAVYSAEQSFTTTGAPLLTATVLTAFGNVCLNTASTANSFTITGSNLTTANVVVGALAGYTYSTTVGGTYTATLTITPAAGVVNQQVFVKLTPTAVQSYNGNIGISGGGATAINVAVTGAGINTTATVTAGAATGITATGATIPGTIPTTGCSTVTAYGAEYSTTTGFANGSGTQVPSTNLAANAFTAVIASGLTASTTYYYHTFATNGGGTVYSAEQSFTTSGTTPPVTGGIVISQVYGSGGNTGAVYNADYVELKNISAAPITLSGYSIQYGSAAVAANWSGVYALPTFTIPAGGFYLIQMTAAGATGANLPTADATASPAINLSGTAGRVALVNGITPLVACPTLPSASILDFVGFGTTATCFEGTGPAAAPSATNADFRKNNGCTETNDNANDFEALAAAPRNSATTAISCTGATPTLSATALTGFGNVCLNTASTANSFTITGSNLTATNVVVGALAGYTYSTTAAGTYTATLTIAPVSGAVSQQVFVKLTPTAVQSYNGNIPVTGGGATAINVAATGAGINTIATVTSGAATAITAASATVAGSITATGCSAVTVYGVEYSTVSGFANGTGTAVPSTNIAAGNFTSALSGLAASTTYYYHAYATNGGGTAYGAQGTFTTTVAVSPTLSASALTAFGNVCPNTTAGPNSFTISGSVLTAANITVGPLAGFTFSTTAGGTYTASLNLTQPGGTYSQAVFVKFTPTAVQSYNGNIAVTGGGATAVNVAASGAGLNVSATIATGGATAITQSGATLAGTIATTGCSAVTAYGIEYSTTSGFANGSGTAVPSTNLAGTGFTAVVTGLAVSTTYYYHAYVTDGTGTSYGVQQSFTTSAATLTVGALTGFGSVCLNTTAGPNSFTISSTLVSAANINVAALTGYTYSTTATGTYTTTLSLTHAAGAYNQTIFVKFTPTAIQSYNGAIAVSGGGSAGNTNVAVTGAGINTGATLTTGAATNVTNTSATLGATVTVAGCGTPTSYGIEYSSIPGLANGLGTKVAATNLVTNTFSSTLTGLVPNSIYYYKAYSSNATGTTYGTELSFTTAALKAGLIIYNNPIVRGGKLAYSVDNLTNAHYTVNIVNNVGQTVYSQGVIVQVNFINSSFIVPASLPAGVYVLEVRNPDGYVANKRFILK